MDDLRGKTAVVTGAASGMGLAFAQRFAAAGMNVVLADVEQPPLDAAVRELRSQGAQALGVVTDVSDGAAVDRLRDRALEAFSRVNVVCNNAGVAGTGPSGGEWVNEKEWRWVLEVNLWGVIHGHRAFLAHLVEHGDGHIINTASMAGHFPGHSAYSASKWAVVGMTEGLYHSLAAQGSTVGVSCLCPGWINTKIADSHRNQPEWAASDALVEPTPAEEARLAYVREQLASGMNPTQVAEMVRAAIVARKFWIFTDPAMVAMLEGRHQSVLHNQDPPAWPAMGA